MKYILSCSTIAFLCAAVTATAAAWSPVSLEQFYIEPSQPAVLVFESSSNTLPTSNDYVLYDTDGNQVGSGKGTLADKRITLSVTLPRGFFEVEFPATNQRFGIVSLSPFAKSQKKVDKFFAMDGALSWLVHKDKNREELIKIAHRIGIGTLRGRLSWGEVEPKEGQIKFDGHRRYEAIRHWYKANDVDFLEVIHDAPGWTGRISKYPLELAKTANSWNKLREHWPEEWTALEVWNEPDISFSGNLSADQYTPLLKSVWNKFLSTDSKTLVVGGVLATQNKTWLANAAENGILDACHIFSFHTYDRANNMEYICSIFQDWLTQNGHPDKELWVTECGRPWKKGPARPTAAEDVVSAIDIIMKAVEAKCCFIDRYFPFVYPYYEERSSNFGMTDRNYAPLRSFAGYAVMIDLLANLEYIGDLNIPGASLVRSRVFADMMGNRVVVFYSDKPEKGKKLTLPLSPRDVRRVTGEPLDHDGCELDFSDGFAYVSYDAGAPLVIEQETAAAKINRARREARENPSVRKAVFPVVLSYRYDLKQVDTFTSGYQFKRELEKATLQFVAFNLSDKVQTVKVQFAASAKNISAVPARTVTIPAGGSTPLEFVLDNLTAVSELAPLKVTAEVTGEQGKDRIVLQFTKELSMKNTLNLTTKNVRLPLQEKKYWRKNQPPYATSEVMTEKELEAANHWGFKATFGEGDRWIYPQFNIPEEIDFSNYDGFIVRAKCVSPDKASLMRFICTETKEKAYLTSKAVIPADGQWHVAIVPFETMTLMNKSHNNHLDREKVRQISIGGNTKGEKLQVEVGDLYLYHK